MDDDSAHKRADGRLPPWLRTRFEGGRTRRTLRQLLRELNLHTVCESARCPNLHECWSRKAATFLLLGDHCSRNCRFCAVGHGPQAPPDPDEPSRIVEAVQRLGLRFVVLTCVTRDDLADGGAGHMARVVGALRQHSDGLGIEVLPSDFQGDMACVRTVVDSGPDVFNHNIETVARLTPQVRDRADYRRSLGVLRVASELACDSERRIKIKSGMMLGMGETEEEIRQTLADLRAAGVQLLTLGQYLPPSADHWPLGRYLDPDEFRKWKMFGEKDIGFENVVSGPLVRSSYLAEQAAGKMPDDSAEG